MWVETLAARGHLTWDRRCIKIRQGHELLRTRSVSITPAGSLSVFSFLLSLSLSFSLSLSLYSLSQRRTMNQFGFIGTVRQL